MTTENQGQPPVNPNPASSLPQQERRWKVIWNQDKLTWLLINGDGNPLLDSDYRYGLDQVASAHNATFSEPKPERVCGLCNAEGLFNPLCPVCRAERDIDSGITDAPADNAQAVPQKPLEEQARYIWKRLNHVIGMDYGARVTAQTVIRECLEERPVASSVVAGIGEHAIGFSLDEEIAREAASTIIYRHGDAQCKDSCIPSLSEIILTAICKAKSLSELKESEEEKHD